ncbi:protein-tyrosine phosphatase [Streptohalobacillus salinus]|uniref:Tyrosine-protein phosphatase n=1 Tax=Streptohalobacillus salinus TaxID=621096 RepID=A0A2V3WFH4_9BACI|nr:CpsB/CapC family capsule biosynthesis tyrosine phosphatase [Streptohalobacillus salinus]PXW92016.1 protein-tyrosine phosphatase [Streptohalobacillus salinus]
MIDLHSHILPGLDDGAKDIDESLALARAAVKEGISGIVATPHHKTSRYNSDKESVLTCVETLNARLEDESIPLTVYPGQEIRIHGEILEEIIQSELLTINQNNRYLLVEFPTEQIPHYASRLLFDIQTHGYTPVIVHPERNHVFLKEPERLYEFVRNGSLTQLTASSLTGQFGKQIKQFSEQILEHRLAHVIASDAHHVERRGFHMKEACLEIEDAFGSPLLNQLLENAHLMLAGETLYIDEPLKPKKKKFFGLF